MKYLVVTICLLASTASANESKLKPAPWKESKLECRLPVPGLYMKTSTWAADGVAVCSPGRTSRRLVTLKKYAAASMAEFRAVTRRMGDTWINACTKESVVVENEGADDEDVSAYKMTYSKDGKRIDMVSYMNFAGAVCRRDSEYVFIR